MIKNKHFLHLTRKALGLIEQDGLRGQMDAIHTLQEELTKLQNKVADALRVETAKTTERNRIPPDDSSWGVHMTHCYSWNYDFLEPDEKPTFRHSCKYGEDDICPAALYEDPYETYKLMTGSGPKLG